MSINCKAAVIRSNASKRPYAKSLPLSVEEISIDPPKENELLVKIHGAGLCHSDLSVINGSRIMQLPLLIGHEGSGEIVELGAAIKDINIGDEITIDYRDFDDNISVWLT